MKAYIASWKGFCGKHIKNPRTFFFMALNAGDSLLGHFALHPEFLLFRLIRGGLGIGNNRTGRYKASQAA